MRVTVDSESLDALLDAVEGNVALRKLAHTVRSSVRKITGSSTVTAYPFRTLSTPSFLIVEDTPSTTES